VKQSLQKKLMKHAEETSEAKPAEETSEAKPAEESE